jgi:hypothetical protein
MPPRPEPAAAEIIVASVVLVRERLAPLRDEHQERRGQRVGAPGERVPEPRDALEPLSRRDAPLGADDGFRAQRLPSRHRLDLRVAHVLQRLAPRHARDELLEHEEVHALVVLERVREVLQQGREVDVLVSPREVAAETRQRLEPERDVLPVRFQLGATARELLDDHERQRVVPEPGEEREGRAHGLDHVRVRLDLGHDRA